MNRCYVCKKIVWPFQGSRLAGNGIHATCHQKLIDACLREDPSMWKLVRDELVLKQNINLGGEL